MMGIPEGEAVDCGVGAIVWVRRRNGSWWPGRILGENELSATHLMSPRSGTPVKLLGREDASIDWYNLEKSKRVKAFRCGEFDDCIRKAELSQGYPPKQREKYARREDAILHALELEKLQMEQQEQKFGLGSNYAGVKRLSIMKRDVENSFPSSSKFRDEDARGTTRYMNIKSQPRSRKVESSLNEEYTSTPLVMQKAKGSQLTWEDNSEIMPRMRGLQDFGLKTASSKKSKSFSLGEGNKRTLPSGDFIHVVSPSFHGAGTANQINNRGPFSMKRKLLNGVSGEESHAKKRDRRRTLVQVLQSSPKLPLGRSSQSDGASLTISRPGGTIHMDALGNSTTEIPPLNEDADCGRYLDKMQNSHPQFGVDKSLLYSTSLTDKMTDVREPDSSDSDPSCHDEDEESAINSDASQELPLLESRSSDRHGSDACRANGKPVEVIGEDIQDSRYLHYASRFHHSEHHPANGMDSVSKWQLKGKRNMRNLSKRHVDIPDDCADGDLYGAEEGAILRPWLSREAFGRYWEEPDDCYPKFYASELAPEYDDYYHHNGKYGSTLLDVDLKVQASYQGEHVPLVSLMSRLNGKAIIGHPVQVEIIEDGSSDILLADSSLNDDSSQMNEGIPVPHVWRTARRTVMHRVPRPQCSALDNEDSLLKGPCLDPEPSLKRAIVGNADQRNVPKKNMNHAARVPMNKLSKKVLKKVSMSNQKTRMLSSFAGEQKTSKNGKQEETPPVVTCIPLNTVFDRLRESLRVLSTDHKDSEVHTDHKDLKET